jgi:hypothetical protein
MKAEEYMPLCTEFELPTHLAAELLFSPTALDACAQNGL